ncbi:MAG TPA: hypothetical protein PKD24_09190 [Pyrinomonadaceae bacterium]|nr:hypothetical protein [Pyrinomonadaceae bacterium]HMP65757.1 hypothetical protein [Pyrinomonadaceae bacterium]
MNVSHIRDLIGTVESEKAAIGVYLTLEPPTKPMLTEAAGKGFHHSPGWNKDYPRLQIVTVEELLAGKQVEMPPSQMTFKQAEKVASKRKDQAGFDLNSSLSNTEKTES